MEYFGHISYGELVMYKDLANLVLTFHDPLKEQQRMYQRNINRSFTQIGKSIYYEATLLEHYKNPLYKDYYIDPRFVDRDNNNLIKPRLMLYFLKYFKSNSKKYKNMLAEYYRLYPD